MLRSYRLFVLALVGLILCGAQPVKEHTQDTHRAQNAQPATAPVLTPYPEHNPDSCYKAQNYDAANLCAQWRSALAAEKAAHEARRATNWAIAGTILSAFGVAGLIFTIFQTHGALGEARRGNRLNLLFEKRSRREARDAAIAQNKSLQIANRNAEATERAIAETQRVGEAQVRCYPTVTSVEIGHTSEESAVVKIRVKNTGLSPAHGVTFNTRVTHFIGGKELIESHGAANKSQFEIDIPAGQDDEIASTIKFKIKNDVPKSPELPFHVMINAFITVDCTDVFGKNVSQADKFSCFLQDVPKPDGSWIKLKRDSRIK